MAEKPKPVDLRPLWEAIARKIAAGEIVATADPKTGQITIAKAKPGQDTPPRVG